MQEMSQNSANLTLTLEKKEGVGSDGHVTTQLVIEGLQNLKEYISPRNVLDIGCGSGVLGIVAAILFDCKVIAADIVPQAVELALSNAVANGVATWFDAVRSDGCDHPAIRERAPYDLVLCNVLAGPLTEWAADISGLTQAQGIAMLSGLLRWQADAVKEAYQAQGFGIIAEYELEGWVMLVLRKDDDDR